MISRIKQLQNRVFDTYLRQYGIEEFNGAQGRILFVLWNEDNLPIVELSKRTSLAKTTLTTMLDRMEKSEFIHRIYDRTDRRQIRIQITDKARALQGKYDEVSEIMGKIFYQGFTDEEILIFENYLKRILNNLMEEE